MVAEHITNLPSTKHSGARARTQMLVVHSAETPLLSGYALSVTVNWLNKMYQANGALIEASINTFFGPDTTVRSVHTDCAAWHASWANAVSVGYEFTGYAALSREQWLTDGGKAMLDRAGREMAADAAHYGIPLRWLTTAEVNAIRGGNTTIKGLATHRQIDPGSRTDPGDGFPYDVLMAAINHYSGTTTSEEEELMSAEQRIMERFDQIVAWEDAHFTLIRNQAEGNRNMLAGFVRDVVATGQQLTAEQINAKLKELEAATGKVQLVKGESSADVFVWDGGEGFRRIDLPEFQALVSAGATLKTIPQERIDAAVAMLEVTK